MRAPPLLIVLFASALAIEDFERDALGAPGPTRANLRGLKFGHSVTEVEDEATDPPAPAPTPAAGGDFADTQDCADCPDCVVPSEDRYGGGYDFSTYDNYGLCVCYVGPIEPYNQDNPDGPTFSEAMLIGTAYDDCIAITELTNGVSGDKAYVTGQWGDDIIVTPTTAWGGVHVFGGDGTDVCVGGDYVESCE